jgi:ankyrin repeat protein
MFPNPQDALPLPPRPNLERYKKLAKQLLKASQSDRVDPLQRWAEVWVESLVKLSRLKITRQLPVRTQRWIDQVEQFARKTLRAPNDGGKPARKRATLADAQFVIARSHGFASWGKFSRQVRALESKSSAESRFEAAADAIVKGDASSLKRMLRHDPSLIHARSSREHGATLLHYVAANGVEGYRQITPKNIVQIAKLLLDGGAEVDATADVYGGGCTTLGLAATSTHPRVSGVQIELLQLLLERGAKIEQPGIGGNRQSAVMACLANGCPEAAQFLAGRGAHLGLEEAAGLGQLEIVKTFFDSGGKRAAGITDVRINSAFRYACFYGKADVAAILLKCGAELTGHDGDGQTGLHYAVIGGQIETISILLKYKPPLEAENVYGGTVLGQALWSAAHGGDAKTYIAILESLTAAGAKIPEKHIAVNARVDAWLEKHGSRVEKSWHWYGEKPRRKHLRAAGRA